MKFKIFTSFVMLVFLASCNQEPKQITNALEYNKFLMSNNETLNLAKKEYSFWAEKLEKTPNQYPYLGKIAAANSQLFNATGTIEYLIKAEKGLIELNTKTQYNNASHLRALARNYISQHRFNEALELLQKAEINAENLKGTQKMLFDVYLELGQEKKAKYYLEKIVNFNDFDYLIRTAKWSDYKGDLQSAIKYMEQAVAKAESSKIKGLMQWAYTNLADFYGHDGQINESYAHFIKALQLNPDDAYAKKGIAWIVYSYERNPKEALRILNAITTKYNAPDYYLIKAEIAEFLNDTAEKNKNMDLYFAAVKNKNYGEMYNAYNAKLFAENKKELEKAFAISKREITNRATPHSYELLALTHLNNNEPKEALKIMEKYVANKTYEPETLYHLATVYKANGIHEKVQNIKEELLEASYELGPLMDVNIREL